MASGSHAPLGLGRNIASEGRSQVQITGILCPPLKANLSFDRILFHQHLSHLTESPKCLAIFYGFHDRLCPIYPVPSQHHFLVFCLLCHATPAYLVIGKANVSHCLHGQIYYRFLFISQLRRYDCLYIFDWLQYPLLSSVALFYFSISLV